jgi:hypothetical protein
VHRSLHEQTAGSARAKSLYATIGSGKHYSKAALDIRKMDIEELQVLADAIAACSPPLDAQNTTPDACATHAIDYTTEYDAGHVNDREIIILWRAFSTFFGPENAKADKQKVAVGFSKMLETINPAISERFNELRKK